MLYGTLILIVSRLLKDKKKTKNGLIILFSVMAVLIGLSRIYLNCTNTKCAALKTEERIVCDINVDCNIVVAGSALKRFLANNYEVIDKINFHNVSNLVVKKYLEDLGCTYGIEVEFIDFGLQLEFNDESSELIV